ncbi:MAG: TrkA C-terminal domain-containing protein [Candidatus Bathyarchaeia archaeon]
MNSEKVATMLAQLKDISEFTVDLAYSSLLCGSEEIADYVIAIEEKMDKLHTEFEMTVLGLRDTRPSKGLLGLIRLSLAAEELVDAAKMMAEIVKLGGRAHPIIKRAFEEAEETIVLGRISETSPLAGKSLGELGLEDDIGMRVIAVERCESWTYNPPDTFVLAVGDTVIARGYSEGRMRFLTLMEPEYMYEQ